MVSARADEAATIPPLLSRTWMIWLALVVLARSTPSALTPSSAT